MLNFKLNTFFRTRNAPEEHQEKEGEGFSQSMGSFGELRISQQEVIQGAKFCQSTNDLAVSSVPRVV